MALQRVPDRLVNIDIIAGETYDWRRAGTPILAVSDVTPLTFSSVGGYAGINLTPSAKPTNPASGDFWWDNSSHVLYQYDGTRAKYISTQAETVIFSRSQGGPIQTTVAMKLGEVATSDAGFVVPNNAVITGIAIERNTNVGSLDVEIRRDDSAATLVTKTLGAGVSKLTDAALDVDISSSVSLQAYVVGAATNTSRKVTIHLTYRLRG